MKSKEELFNIIDRYSNYTVLVLGDIILDEYIWGKASRLSPEAPVPILEVQKNTHIPGGAANVANNIIALGGKAVLMGIIGDDIQAAMLITALENNAIDPTFIIKDPERPTTVKTRLIAHNQQLTRADKEVKTPINADIENKILAKIKYIIDDIDLVLLSDYAKGVLTPSLTEKIINIAKLKNKPVLVDPKGLDFSKYSGATMITPNRLEAELATKLPTGSPPELLAELISKQANIDYILVTLGEDGILLYLKDKIKTIPAVASEVYDVTGAGDSLISSIALSLPASDNDIETSIAIGNFAAGIAVRKIGTTTVMPEELKHIIEQSMIKYSSEKN